MAGYDPTCVHYPFNRIQDGGNTFISLTKRYIIVYNDYFRVSQPRFLSVF